jgi:hypothetical protein
MRAGAAVTAAVLVVCSVVRSAPDCGMISSTRSSRLGDPQMQHDGPRWVLSRVGSHALAWRGVATLQLRGGGRRARKYNPRNKKAQFTRKTRKSEGEAAGSTGGDQRGGEIRNAGRRGEGRTEDKPEGRRHGSWIRNPRLRERFLRRHRRVQQQGADPPGQSSPHADRGLMGNLKSIKKKTKRGEKGIAPEFKVRGPLLRASLPSLRTNLLRVSFVLASQVWSRQEDPGGAVNSAERRSGADEQEQGSGEEDAMPAWKALRKERERLRDELQGDAQGSSAAREDGGGRGSAGEDESAGADSAVGGSDSSGLEPGAEDERRRRVADRDLAEMFPE